MEELERLALEIRGIIYDEFPEEYDYYIGELISSPEGVFSVAEEICKKYWED